MFSSGFGRTGLGLPAAILFLSAGFSVAAWADEELDYARTGFYVGLGVGYATDMAYEDELDDSLDSLYPDEDLDASVKDSAAINAHVGYRVLPYLATELQLEYVINAETEVEQEEIWTHQLVLLTANVKVPLVRGRLQPFLLAGVGLLHARFEGSHGLDWSMNDTGLALRAGGGLEFYFVESISLRLDVNYVVPFGDVKDLDFISVGLGAQYRF